MQWPRCDGLVHEASAADLCNYCSYIRLEEIVIIIIDDVSFIFQWSNTLTGMTAQYITASLEC